MKVFLKVALLPIVLLVTAQPLFGQAGNSNPGGPVAEYHGNSTIAGNYDPFTGNARREIDDIVVPGAVGAYPLKWTRTLNTRGAGTGYFDAGGWTHNYTWNVYVRPPDADNGAEDQGGLYTGLVRQIAYPAGGNYQDITYDSPWLIDANGKHSAWDRLMTCASGHCTPDSIAAYELWRADGGKVLFEASPQPRNYRAYKIVDPFGQATTLTYNAAGKLWKITEPGGRYLELIYEPYSYWDSNYPGQLVTANMLTGVQANDGRGNVTAAVSYEYEWIVQGYYWTEHTPYLIHAYYSDGAQATYTYETANSYDPPLPDINHGHLRRVVHSCDDPRYAGPMKYIEYEYVQASEVQEVGHGQIKAEKNVLGQVVTRTNYPTYPSTIQFQDPYLLKRIETRGDGPSRTFDYASPGGGWTWTDFKDHTWRETTSTTIGAEGWTVTDARGNPTIYHTENVLGAVDKITYPQTNPGQPTPTKEYTFSDPYNPCYHSAEKDENGNLTTYERDPNTNQVTKITYPGGVTEEFTYNAFGQVETHKLKGAGTENFRYDSRGLKKFYWPAPTESDPNPEAHKTEYYYYEAYDGHPDWIDRLKGVRDPRGNTTWFEYNQRGQVTKVMHQDGTYTQSAYNLDGTLAWTADENHPGAATDPNQRTRYIYDEYKRVRFVTNPMGETTETSYGLNPMTWGDPLLHTTNNPKYTLSPMSKNVIFGYDENLRKAYQVQAMNTADESWNWFDYDEVGNLNWTRDPRWNVTTFGYDQRNRKIWMKNPIPTDRNANGHTMEWKYDGVGNKVRETRADGVFRSWAYTAWNQLWYAYDWRTNETPAADQTTAYDHDNAGNVHAIVDTKGAVYVFEHDAMNRRISTTYPADATGVARTETFKYDFAGNLSLYKNPAGQYKHMDYADSYDSRNRLRRVGWNNSATDNLNVDWSVGPETRTEYDAASRMTQIKTNNGETVVGFAYDAANRKVWEEQTVAGYPMRGVQHDFNADGNAMNTHVPGWHLNWYDYNARNQVRQISDGAGNPWITFAYDAAGNVTKRQAVYGGANDSLNVPSEYYDGLNRPTRWENTGLNDVMFARSLQQYDSVGRMTATSREEEGGKGERFTFNERNQVTRVNYKADQPMTTNPQNSARIEDFAVNALNRQSVSDSAPATVNGLAASYYNGNDLGASGAQPVTKTDGTVNFAWNMASPAPGINGEGFSARWEGQVMPAYSETYTFYTQADDGVRLWVNGQLVVNDWNYHGTLEYSGTIALVAGQKYDIKLEYMQGCCGANVALLWSSASQGKEIIPQNRLFVPAGGSYQVSALNQYTKVGMRAVGYDGNFNLTSFDGANFTYNAQNQLVSGTKGANLVQFVYDGLGRCLKRTTNGFAVIFLYDGWKPIVEWAGDNSYWGFRLYGAGPDEILWHYDSRVGYQRVHSDTHGNVIALLDWGGNGSEKYTYEAFGKPKITDWAGNERAASAVYNRFLFQGREWIAELGIYDYRRRMYLPGLGRFLQTDPLGLQTEGEKLSAGQKALFSPGGVAPDAFGTSEMNLYRYCGDDPVDGSDPMGLLRYVFHETFSESARAHFLKKVKPELEKSARYRQIDAADHRTITVAPTDSRHQTGLGFRKGDSKHEHPYLFVNPHDSRYLDAGSKKAFDSFPKELPPAGEKGQASVVAHEIGHLYIPRRDIKSEVLTVEKYENPIRHEMGVNYRPSFFGHEVSLPNE